LEASRQAKDAIEGAETKARSILSGAEARGRKYINVAEDEAAERVAEAEREAQSLFDEKRREAAALALAARREGERIITEATGEVAEYRNWLSGVISEAERLYRIQTQSLDAAENAISQSRSRLDSAYSRLAELHKNVNDNLKADNSVIDTGPKKVVSQRTKPALDAPKKKAASKKAVAKKKPAKRK
jgi:vacuolar-type H+-ATPase subunit H